MSDLTPESVKNTPIEVVRENGKIVIKYEGDIKKEYDDSRRGIQKAKGFAEGYVSYKP
jgi:hypothetical protein